MSSKTSLRGIRCRLAGGESCRRHRHHRRASCLATIRVIHHADGRYYTLTEGIVSRRYTDSHRGESQWITITADYARGSSGGPLFNDAGEVIGIVASTHSVYYDQAEDGTQQNLQMVWKQCVPVESIRALIE